MLFLFHAPFRICLALRDLSVLSHQGRPRRCQRVEILCIGGISHLLRLRRWSAHRTVSTRGPLLIPVDHRSVLFLRNHGRLRVLLRPKNDLSSARS